MTIIVIAICVAIAAIVLAIIFVPGVGSALAMGFGTAFFKVLAENRQKRVAIRQERWRLRRGREPAPADPEAKPDAKPDATPAPVEAAKRVRLFQEWRRRDA